MACPCLCESQVDCSDLGLESRIGYCEGMKVAAYQAPLLATGSMDALGLIQKQVRKCETDGITVLCCPEAILGGLADYSGDPNRFALSSARWRSDSRTSSCGATGVGSLFCTTARLCKRSSAGPKNCRMPRSPSSRQPLPWDYFRLAR